MSANNFEQEVEQRLAQLQLMPSDGVWQKLEAGLQKKKRRRAFFLYFLTALLCTGGGYLLWTQSADKTDNTQTLVQSTTAPTPSGAVADSGKIKVETNPVVTTGEAIENGTATPAVENNTLVTDKPAVTTIDGVQPGINNNNKDNNGLIVSRKKNTNERKQIPRLTGNTKRPESVSSIANIDSYVAETGNKPELNKTDNIVDNSNKQHHVLVNASGETDRTYRVLPDTSDIAAFAINNIPSPLLTGNNELAANKTKRRYPFYWGVEVLAGVSGSMEKKELASKATAMDASPVMNSGSYTNTSPFVNNAAIWESQNVHRASTAHSFGLVGYKQFTKRNAVSFGLSYQYLSTATKVGDSATTVNSNNTMRTYYYGREMKNYINKFHFINIPVTHHLILNKNENMPFSWDLGMSVSQLISTNALITSSYLGGSLHKDKHAFTRTHFFVHTGLTIGLTNNKNSIWQLGPVVNYGFNKIGRYEGDDKNFWEVGIKLRYLLR
jgi:hypothetical protein